jgi:PTS system N-acetylgalactosamine-specific IIC component
MEYSILQVALVFIVTFICAIDQFSFLESLYQPIVTGMVIGLILGDVQTGLIVGGTYQLMTIGNMPVGGAQPPNAVVGGIMAAVLAISAGLDPTAAVAAAIPFSLLGQYGVTLIFTIMSPLMTKADQYAHEANPAGITRLNYAGMGFLGLIFGGVIRVHLREHLGGVDVANIVNSITALQTPALIVLALIGFGLAFWDYQIQVKFKVAGPALATEGGEEDGI